MFQTPISQHGMNPASLRSFLTLLPRNLHLDKMRAKQQDATNSNANNADSNANHNATNTIQEDFTIMEENEEFDKDDNESNTNEERKDALLQNTWQYKLSVQKQRRAQYTSNSTSKASGKKEYCHSYDLSRRMMDQHPPNWMQQKMENGKLSIFNASNCSNGIMLYQQCVQHIMTTISQHPNGVLRLVFINTPILTISITLPLLQSYIRHHSLPVVILLSVRPWTIQSSLSQSQSIQSLISLRRTCDAVLTCEGFDAMTSPPPSEFSDLAGLCSLPKVALQSQAHFCDSTTTRRPPANRYGMKRDRRKVHIRMLHLPPEDFSKDGSSVGSGVRSGAGNLKKDKEGERKTALQPGLGCASNLRSKNAMSLDF